MFIIRFVFYFTLSFLVFCIPVNNKPLFNHAYHFASDITHQSISFVYKHLKLGFNLGENKLRKLFSLEEDNVNSQFSSLQKAKTRSRTSGFIIEDKSPMGSYTDEEKKLLEKVLTENN